MWGDFTPREAYLLELKKHSPFLSFILVIVIMVMSSDCMQGGTGCIHLTVVSWRSCTYYGVGSAGDHI